LTRQERFRGARLDAIDTESSISVLERSLGAVGTLVDDISFEKWGAPTPCTDWTVRQVVGHLVGMNRVFAAMLVGEPPPQRGDALPDDELSSAYRTSASDLLGAFAEPDVLERSFSGPMGTATGGDRLNIRMYDLLAHGWDLAAATGLPAAFPEGAAEQALSFVRSQLADDARPGRFEPAQPIPDDAPAIERLVAFLGRQVQPWRRP
jgi:uncharacterized protein (TIGR03086 family)